MTPTIGQTIRVQSGVAGSCREGQTSVLVSVSEPEPGSKKQQAIFWVRFADGIRNAFYARDLVVTGD